MESDVFNVVFTDGYPESEDIKVGTLYVCKKLGLVTMMCPVGKCAENGVFSLFSVNIDTVPEKVISDRGVWHYEEHGGMVTLSPSIDMQTSVRGKPCDAHFFIRDNRIVWAGKPVCVLG